MNLQWTWRRFGELPPAELYAVMQLRQAVFVVEQNCPFQDADGQDADAEHLLGRDGRGELLAYLRLHGSGRMRDEAVFSRVVTAESIRRQGAGIGLLNRAIERIRQQEPRATVWIGAQQRLQAFYARFGFVVCSEPYLEDDIWHVGMRAPAADLRCGVDA